MCAWGHDTQLARHGCALARCGSARSTGMCDARPLTPEEPPIPPPARSSDSSALARDVRSEIKSLNGQLLRLGPRDRQERRSIRADLRRLAKEERQRQEAAVAEVRREGREGCGRGMGAAGRGARAR
jgi:hypothetical protein